MATALADAKPLAKQPNALELPSSPEPAPSPPSSADGRVDNIGDKNGQWFKPIQNPRPSSEHHHHQNHHQNQSRESAPTRPNTAPCQTVPFAFSSDKRAAERRKYDDAAQARRKADSARQALLLIEADNAERAEGLRRADELLWRPPVRRAPSPGPWPVRLRAGAGAGAGAGSSSRPASPAAKVKAIKAVAPLSPKFQRPVSVAASSAPPPDCPPFSFDSISTQPPAPPRSGPAPPSSGRPSPLNRRLLSTGTTFSSAPPPRLSSRQ